MDVNTVEPSGTPGRGGRHRRHRAEPVPRPAAAEPTGTAAPGPAADEPTADGSAAPRAGRNLPMAIGVGLALAAVVVVSLVVSRPVFVGLIAVAVVVGCWELVRAVRPAGSRPPLVPVLAGGAGMVVLAWFNGPDGLLLGLALTLATVVLWRIPDGPVGIHRDVTAAALVAAYVPFLAGFAVLLAAPDDGRLRVLAFIVTVVCSDTGGYAAGALLGRHPMAPTVSPKKSWEGMAGSLVACALAGVGFLVFGFGAAWWQGVLFGTAVAVAATLGDLAESMIKRDLGIKDMGALLPGHGGLMDRLDSLLIAAPVAYLLLALFAPAS